MGFRQSLRHQLVLWSFLFGSSSAFGAGVTYHGRLLKANGSAVDSTSVTFKLQIRTPGNENCLLYEEQQVKDLSQSKGIFALTLNDGTATVVNTEPFTLDRAFQNRGTFNFGGGKCVVGSTYAPNPGDGRRIVVEFNDGSFTGWEQMPPQAINHVPMSLESMTVGGYGAANLMRVVDGSGAPVVVSALTQTQHNALIDLVNGTSASYLSTSSPAVGFTGALSGDVTGTQSATVVTKLQGRAVDTAAPSNGQALVWSAGNNRWEPGTVSGGASDWSTLSGKPATFPSDWSTLSNIPSTFSPSAHSHPINEITSGSGAYFNYSPNGAACAAGEVLKWDTGGGGRWICGVDAGSAGTLVSLTTNAPIVKTGTTSDPILSISDASTSAKGVVQLAASSDTTAGLVVQANDSRLTDGRAPTGTASGELTGNYPSPTVVASTTASNNSLVRRDGSGGITGAAGNFSSLALTNGTSTLTLSTPVAFTTYATKLPATAGSNGQVMTSNGTDMMWSNASSLTAGNVSGIVAIANGGTGATTASGARTNLGLTTTGDALATAADATAARTAISALSSTDSRLAPAPSAGNALNYIRVNSGGTAYEARTAGNVLSDIGAMTAVAAGSTGNVLTSNGTSWTSSALPNATTGAKGVMQVGTGLAVSSGTVSADFGTGSGKVAQGNDSRFPAATCGAGNKMRWDGTAWQCETDSVTDTTKVAKSGDTMTGTLNLPANGLVLGTNQLVAGSGNVGIGTSSPTYKLQVAGGAAGVVLTTTDFVNTSTGSAVALATGANTGDTYGIVQATKTGGTVGTILALNPVGGNVGVGTVTPTRKFQIYTASADQNVLYAECNGGWCQNLVTNGTISADFGVQSSGSNVFFGSNTNHDVVIRANQSEKIRILTDGRVGIGTSSPTSALDVNGTARVAGSVESASASVNSGTAYTIPDLTRNVRLITLTGNATITLPATSGLGSNDVYTLTLKLRQDATGNRSVTWAGGGGTIKWDGGVTPGIATDPNLETIVQFTAIGGVSTWYASIVWREN